MMQDTLYPAARSVAETVASHFARLRETMTDTRQRPPEVGEDAVEALVNAGFWASLRREEGRFPRISLALLPPEQGAEGFRFEQRLPLAPRTLTRLAPAVVRPGIHLGVWHEAGHFYLWGAVRRIPDLCFVLEVFEPGLLVVKYSQHEALCKYGNVAVLRGDTIKVVDEQRADRPDCPAFLASLIRRVPSASWPAAPNVLVRLATSMRAHGHGGILLVVPDGTRHWQGSIVGPILYKVGPPYTRLGELARRDPREQRSLAWQRTTERAINGVAGLTAVDGATVITDRYDLLAFGVTIKRAAQSTSVEQVVVSEPVVGNTPIVVEAVQLGGTRHLSAAQFVHDQHDAVALVASQDGAFTLFVWSEQDEKVHVHRVESLLL